MLLNPSGFKTAHVFLAFFLKIDDDTRPIQRQGSKARYAAKNTNIDSYGDCAFVVRRRVCTDMAFLGIVLDEQANMRHVPWAKVRPASPHLGIGPTKVMVIPTNEELVIARDTKEILFG